MTEDQHSVDSLLDKPTTQPSLDELVNQSDAAHHTWNGMIADFREKHPIASQLALAIPDFIGGVGSGVVSTGLGAYDLARKIPGVDGIFPPVSPDLRKETIPPPSIAGNVGKFAEQGAEYMVPELAASRVAGPLPAVARVAGHALGQTGVAAVQSGGDPTSMMLAGGTAGVLGGAGEALSGLARTAVEKAAESPRPLSPEVLDFAKRYNIPLMQGDISGSKIAQTLQKMLGSSVASDKYEPLVAGQQQALNEAAMDTAQQLAGDTYSGGQGVLGKLLDKAKNWKATGSGAYGDLESLQQDPKNIKVVQTGTRPMLGVNGQPITDAGGKALTVPVTENMSMPVDIRPMKAGVQPLVDQIMKDLTPGQQMYSPSLHAAKQLAEQPDTVPLADADTWLSTLKTIQRDAKTPRAKFLATKLVDQMSPTVDKAAMDAGPDAMDALQKGRMNWKKQADVMGLVKDLGADTEGKSGFTELSNKLLQNADKSYPELQRVLAVAPDAAEDLRGAALKRIFNNSLDEGDFSKPVRVATAWANLGSRTKQAIFSPQHISDIDSVLALSKRLSENPNPSNTGMVNTLLKLGYLAVHPVAGVSGIVMGRQMADVLYNPEGATALRTLIKSAPGSMNYRVATAVLDALKAGSSETASRIARPDTIQAEITKPGIR